MSGAANPRQTGLWRDTVIAARTVIEDKTDLPQAAADTLAEAVAERLLGDFLAYAEETSWVAFTPEGTGPVCTWCGQIPGPRLSPTHPQYGIFCACNRKPAGDEEEAAA
jgi:hypothetical protein